MGNSKSFVVADFEWKMNSKNLTNYFVKGVEIRHRPGSKKVKSEITSFSVDELDYASPKEIFKFFLSTDEEGLASVDLNVLHKIYGSLKNREDLVQSFAALGICEL